VLFFLLSPKHHNRLSLTRHWHPQVKLSCRGPARLSPTHQWVWNPKPFWDPRVGEKAIYNSIEPSHPSSHGLLTLFFCFLLFEAQQQTWPDKLLTTQSQAQWQREGWQNLSHLHTSGVWRNPETFFGGSRPIYHQASYITQAW
jgi:hypothetical protein